MKVAILGSGPEAMLIGFAATEMGATHVTFYSSIQGPVPMRGLHVIPRADAPIQRAEYDTTPLSMGFLGSARDYIDRAYPEGYYPAPEAVYAEEISYVDMKKIYMWLWSKFRDNVLKTHVIQNWSELYQKSTGPNGYDFVFSTYPQNQVCTNSDHHFLSRKVYRLTEADSSGYQLPYTPYQITYNGDPKVGGWIYIGYGFDSWEVHYPGDRKPPIEGFTSWNIPLKTDCNCWPNLIPLGVRAEHNEAVFYEDVYKTAKTKMSVGQQSALF